MVWQPHPSLNALSSSWQWTLYVSSPYCQAFHQRSLPIIPRSLSPSRSLVHSGGSLQSLIPPGCLFPFLLLVLRSSVFFPHQIPDQVPLFPQLPMFTVHFLSQIPPSLPTVTAFFSFPSGTAVSSLRHFTLTFLSSVDCIFGILYLLFWGSGFIWV